METFEMGSEYRIFVVKYALTKGIFETKGNYRGLCRMRVKINGFNAVLFEKEYDIDKAMAICKAEKKRVNKLKNLRKQIGRLEAMTFDI